MITLEILKIGWVYPPDRAHPDGSKRPILNTAAHCPLRNAQSPSCPRNRQQGFDVIRMPAEARLAEGGLLLIGVPGLCTIQTFHAVHRVSPGTQRSMKGLARHTFKIAASF